jgi:hypothetical protein
MKNRSRSRRRGLAVLVIAMSGFAAACASGGGAGGGGTSVLIYDSNPSPTPGNIPSHGFECCSTSQFGDEIAFAAGPRHLDWATVTMSSWALHATYPAMDPTGFDHPLTLNIYADNAGTQGTLLGTVTQVVHVPWRPPEDPGNCPTKDDPGYPYKWKDDSGTCRNGYAFQVIFDLRGLYLTAPDKIVWGVSYPTQTRGTVDLPALGVPGPYNSLNVGSSGNGATVGTDVDTDVAFVNGLPQTGWTGLTPTICIWAH